MSIFDTNIKHPDEILYDQLKALSCTVVHFASHEGTRNLLYSPCYPPSIASHIIAELKNQNIYEELDFYRDSAVGKIGRVECAVLKRDQDLPVYRIWFYKIVGPEEARTNSSYIDRHLKIFASIDVWINGIYTE